MGSIKLPVYVQSQFDKDRFPVIDKFRHIWDDARRDRFAPSWRDLNFEAFPTAMLPYMYLVDVLRDPYRFRYRFIGTRICELEGRDYTNKFVHDLRPSTLAAAAVNEFRTFAKNPKPVFFMMVADEDGDRENLYRVYGGARLPLSDDGKTLSQIIALAQFERENTDLKDLFFEKRRARSLETVGLMN